MEQNQKMQDILQQQEEFKKQAAEIKLKVDAIYQALMGSDLLGAESGLVARGARQSLEIQNLQTRCQTLEKEMEKYKNTAKGIWLAIGVGAAVLTWLLSNLDLLKPLK